MLYRQNMAMMAKPNSPHETLNKLECLGSGKHSNIPSFAQSCVRALPECYFSFGNDCIIKPNGVSIYPI